MLATALADSQVGTKKLSQVGSKNFIYLKHKAGISTILAGAGAVTRCGSVLTFYIIV
jgi:hypothetical protein